MNRPYPYLNDQLTRFNVIVDMSNIIHRSMGVVSYEVTKERRAAEQHMSNTQGIIEEEKLPPSFDLNLPKHKARVVRKIFIDLISLIKKIPTKRLFCCFDGNTFRKQVASTYKAKRPEKSEAFKELLEEVFAICKMKNLNAFMVSNLEADDCAVLLTQKLHDEWNVIVSADADVIQAVNTQTFVLVPLASKRTLFIPDVQDVYNLKLLQQWYPDLKIVEADPLYILTEKFLKGCTSDEIAGIAPKGFRKTNVELIAERLRNECQNQECTIVGGEPDYVEAFLGACHPFEKVKFTADEAYKQLQLVCLGMQYIPLDGLLAFDDIAIVDQPIYNMSVDYVLRNTPYWSEY